MIDELKKKKLEEFQNQVNSNHQDQINEQRKVQEQIFELEKIAKQFMDKEAIERYGRLKIAHQEIAIKAIALIAQAVSVGQIKEILNDKEFKNLLQRLQEGKKEYNFKK